MRIKPFLSSRIKLTNWLTNQSDEKIITFSLIHISKDMFTVNTQTLVDANN